MAEVRDMEEVDNRRALAGRSIQMPSKAKAQRHWGLSTASGPIVRFVIIRSLCKQTELLRDQSTSAGSANRITSKPVSSECRARAPARCEMMRMQARNAMSPENVYDATYTLSGHAVLSRNGKYE